MKIIKNLMYCTVMLVGASYLYTQNVHAQVQNQSEPHRFSHAIAKFFNDNDIAKIKNNEIIWEKSTQEWPFNELILSWNALRPKTGHMTVYVSVKHRNKWFGWHRLAQWGPNFQRTFVNKLNPIVHTKHCRVELQLGKVARGLRVKVVFHGGADPHNLKALFANVTRLNHFRFLAPNTQLPSVFVNGIPRQSQMLLNHPRFKDLCSPSSTSMIVSYFYEKLYGTKPNESMHDYALDFARKAHDQGYLDIYGNWILNVAHAFDACNGDVYFRVERLNSFNDLYSFLSKKIPVAVSVRRLRGGATPYANGHIMVVMGWNRRKQAIVCIDPAFGSNKATLKAYPIRSFLRAWSRSSNLAYVPMPKSPLG